MMKISKSFQQYDEYDGHYECIDVMAENNPGLPMIQIEK
jgi:hypothetical protein